MVNGLLNTNKNHNCINQNDQQKTSIPNADPENPTGETIPNKLKKKSDKSKRIDTKRSITKFFKSSPKESCGERQQSSTSKRAITSNDTNSKSLVATKVKSGSWKRSDKTNTTRNVLTNKKPKSLRRKSPNLLTFYNAPIKLNEKPFSSESNSACRPGTLYSDVVFGAAPTSLIKVKILTPRRNTTETAQKKLTKALLKYSKDSITDESEAEEEDQSVFPSLHRLPHLKARDTKSYLRSSSPTSCSDSINTIQSLDISPYSESLPTSVSSPTKSDSFKEADVVILSDHNEDSHAKGTCQISYGNYLEEQFQKFDVNNKVNTSNSHTKSQFHCDVSSWNFTKPDENPDAFPKFLQQFDDENYLNLEKFAMLGLDLDKAGDATSFLTSLPTSSSSPTQTEADVVILPDQNECSEVGSSPVTYSSYLEEQFHDLRLDYEKNTSRDLQQSQDSSRPKSQIDLDIPSWNFTKPDINSDGFPKFLQQFDDENYLKLERSAMLGLNLAMGNRSHQGSFNI